MCLKQVPLYGPAPEVVQAFGELEGKIVQAGVAGLVEKVMHIVWPKEPKGGAKFVNKVVFGVDLWPEDKMLPESWPA